MANLGVLNVRTILKRYVVPVKHWVRGNTVPLVGRIEGVITTGGEPTPFARVSLHYTPTGAVLSREITDMFGFYAFGKNARLPVAISPDDGANYYVVAEDPETTRNAVITDRVTPHA